MHPDFWPSPPDAPIDELIRNVAIAQQINSYSVAPTYAVALHELGSDIDAMYDEEFVTPLFDPASSHFTPMMRKKIEAASAPFYREPKKVEPAEETAEQPVPDAAGLDDPAGPQATADYTWPSPDTGPVVDQPGAPVELNAEPAVDVAPLDAQAEQSPVELPPVEVPLPDDPPQPIEIAPIEPAVTVEEPVVDVQQATQPQLIEPVALPAIEQPDLENSATIAMPVAEAASQQPADWNASQDEAVQPPVAKRMHRLQERRRSHRL